MRGYPDQWEPYSPRERLLRWLWLAGIAVAAAWSVSALDIEWAFFADAHEQAADLIERMWPPRWSYAPTILAPLIETIHIATLGTAIAVVFSIPLAFLSARNTTANLTRDASLGLHATTINYYDGQGFLVPKKLKITSANFDRLFAGVTA